MAHLPPHLPHEFGSIDFSQAHFLDHRIWRRRCATLPGGRRRHLSFAWTYQWAPWLRQHTLCAVGWHAPAQHWRGKSPFVACRDCSKRLPGYEPGSR